jgi:GNAT superfamily N-acetyltransferase
MIEGIDRITYGIEDTPEQWARVRRFYSDWGLHPLAAQASHETWETLNGAQVCVRAINDPQLDPAIEPGSTLREVQWGVSDAVTLQQLHQQLHTLPGFHSQGVGAAGVGPEARVSCLDPHGLRQVFALSLKRPVDVRGAAANAYGDIRRIDQASPVYERAMPVDIGHVVLFTDRLQAAEDFYQALGFVTSDRYPGRCRCPAKRWGSTMWPSPCAISMRCLAAGCTWGAVAGKPSSARGGIRSHRLIFGILKTLVVA